MRFYNSLTRQKEEYRRASDDLVHIYSCGPTVWNYAHIGNLRTFVFEDLLRRWLKSQGHTVYQVKNLTDVDDKIIKAAQEQNREPTALTEEFAQAFFTDIQLIGIERIEAYPRATQHIPEMLVLVQKLLDEGYAYRTSTGVYFRTSKAGGLGFVETSNLEAGASGRVEIDPEKENPADFALWKAWTAKDGNTFWEAPWGRGRPGWHLECSAMSLKHLSKIFENEPNHRPIDIHTGGIDLTFPHHQSEILQSEACGARPFARYWLHCEHLMVDGQKMAKSLGNFYTLRDLMAKGYNPRALRYLLLSVHYRQPLNFTFASLEAAGQALQRLYDFYNRLVNLSAKHHSLDEMVDGPIPPAYDKNSKPSGLPGLTIATSEAITAQFNDDLHVPKALAILFDYVNRVNGWIDEGRISVGEAKIAITLLGEVNSILNILTFNDKLTPDQLALLERREQARKAKLWAQSDLIRDKLKDQGIIVEDTPQGQRWKRAINDRKL